MDHRNTENAPLVVWLPQGDRSTPSSRLRSLAVSAWMEKNQRARNLYPPFEINEVPAALFVEKKCGPQTLQIAAQLKPHGTRIVYDLCDPVWLQPDINRQRKWDIGAMLSLADCITVPTVTLANDLLEQFSKVSREMIQVIPDMLDFDDANLCAVAQPKAHTPLRIGWIGSSLNMEHIPMIAETVTAFSEKVPAIMRLITKSHQGLVTAVPRVPVEYWPWTEDGFLDALRECDVVVIPMVLRPATRTKSANRLQVCLAAGVPVVASPVPSYLELMGDSRIVLFAETPEEWRESLQILADCQERCRRSEAGAAFARAHCRFSDVTEKWCQAVLGLDRPNG